MTPEFIIKLREKVGHTELWLPGATAIILRKSPDAPSDAVQEVLLVQRSDNGQWTPVTGICDPHEDPHLTAIREAEEETGVKIQVDRLLWVQAVGPVTYPNGDIASFVDSAFVCSVLPESPEARVNDDESVKVAWFTELPPMKPRFAQLIDAARTGKTGFGTQN